LRELVDEARKLGVEERIELAEAILASIEPDPELERQWAEEAEERFRACRRGEMATMDFDEVIAELRASEDPAHGRGRIGQAIPLGG
jgi:putative addiction module component (TIGR02574 family)